MRKTLLFPLLCCLGLTTTSHAQNLFVESFSSPSTREIFTGIKYTTDNTLLISGYTIDTLFFPNGGYAEATAPLITELDTAGHVLRSNKWPVDFNTWGWTYLNGIDRYEDQTYACGYRSSYVPNVPNDALITRLDSLGHPLWVRSIGTSSGTVAEHIRALPEGGCVVAGSFNGNGWMAALDAQGNGLWSHLFPHPFVLMGMSLSSDGNILVCGEGDPVGTTSGTSSFIAKVSTAGNMIWTKRYQLGFQSRVNDVIETSDHHIACTGFVSATGPARRPYLLETDTDGTFRKCMDYDGFVDGMGLSITENQQHELVITGGESISNNAGSIFTLSLDSIGWPIVAQLRLNTSMEQVSQATVGADNRLYFIGFRGQHTNPLLIKTTPQGFFGCNSINVFSSPTYYSCTDTTGATLYYSWALPPGILQVSDTLFPLNQAYCYTPDVTGLQQQTENDIRIFPVPASDAVTIQFGTIPVAAVELSDITGKRLRSIKVIDGSKEMTLARENLAPGIYFCRFTDTAGKQLAIRKLIFGQ